ncbi:unnamed protein product, partial [Didymodactylos carnosus]
MAVKIRTTTGTDVWLSPGTSIGTGLDGNTSFSSGDALKFDTDNITKIVGTEVAIEAIDINGKGAETPTDLQFIGECSLGSVVNLVNNQQMTVTIGQAKVEDIKQENIEAALILTGKCSIPEFQTKSNNYTAISKIVFASTNSTLSVKSADNQPIHFNGIFGYMNGTNQGSTLNVISDFLVQDPNIAYTHKINIGSNEGTTKPAILNVNYGKEGNGKEGKFDLLVNAGIISFLHPDSKLQLQNDKTDEANRTISLHHDLASQDNEGIIEFNTIDSKSITTISDVEVEGYPGYRRGTIGKKEKKGVSRLTFNKEVTANVNFHEASTVDAKDNIIGNIDYKNLNAKVTIEGGKKIDGKVISTGGKKGELNFPTGGEVTGNIGDDKNGIKIVNLNKGTLKLANAVADINFNGAS